MAKNDFMRVQEGKSFDLLWEQEAAGSTPAIPIV